jgi:hypothetical protein
VMYDTQSGITIGDALRFETIPLCIEHLLVNKMH